MGFISDTSIDLIIDFISGIFIIVLGTVLGKDIKEGLEKSLTKWGLIILFVILIIQLIRNYHGT